MPEDHNAEFEKIVARQREEFDIKEKEIDPPHGFPNGVVEQAAFTETTSAQRTPEFATAKSKDESYARRALQFVKRVVTLGGK